MGEVYRPRRTPAARCRDQGQQRSVLTALGQAKVPEAVFKAMAARANRIAQPSPAAAQAPAKTLPPAPVSVAAPAPQPRIRPDRSSEYQGRGMWDVKFEGSALVPHSDPSFYSGVVSGALGYLVARKSEVGFLRSISLWATGS